MRDWNKQDPRRRLRVYIYMCGVWGTCACEYIYRGCRSVELPTCLLACMAACINRADNNQKFRQVARARARGATLSIFIFYLVLVFIYCEPEAPAERCCKIYRRRIPPYKLLSQLSRERERLIYKMTETISIPRGINTRVCSHTGLYHDERGL